MTQRNEEETLRQIMQQRGYVLSFHRMWAGHEPELIERYNAFYDVLAFDVKDMSVGRRELIWIAALAAAGEDRGRLHVDRAIAAGVSREDILAAIALAVCPDLYSTLAFAQNAWGVAQSGDKSAAEYRAAFQALAGPIDIITAHLAAGAAMAVRRNKDGCSFHFELALSHGASSRQVVEAASIVFMPGGAPALMLAADVFVDLVDKVRNEKPSCEPEKS